MTSPKFFCPQCEEPFDADSEAEAHTDSFGHTILAWPTAKTIDRVLARTDTPTVSIPWHDADALRMLLKRAVEGNTGEAEEDVVAARGVLARLELASVVPTLYVVLRKRETEPAEIWLFEDYDDAATQWDIVAANWSDVYFCRVVYGPSERGAGAVGERPQVTRPFSASDGDYDTRKVVNLPSLFKRLAGRCVRDGEGQQAFNLAAEFVEHTTAYKQDLEGLLFRIVMEYDANRDGGDEFFSLLRQARAALGHNLVDEAKADAEAQIDEALPQSELAERLRAAAVLVRTKNRDDFDPFGILREAANAIQGYEIILRQTQVLADRTNRDLTDLFKIAAADASLTDKEVRDVVRYLSSEPLSGEDFARSIELAKTLGWSSEAKSAEIGLRSFRAHKEGCAKALSVPVDRCDCGGRDVPQQKARIKFLPRPSVESLRNASAQLALAIDRAPGNEAWNESCKAVSAWLRMISNLAEREPTVVELIERAENLIREHFDAEVASGAESDAWKTEADEVIRFLLVCVEPEEAVSDVLRPRPLTADEWTHVANAFFGKQDEHLVLLRRKAVAHRALALRKEEA